jgi:flagella basal body P-ring formation protein FlgA
MTRPALLRPVLLRVAAALLAAQAAAAESPAPEITADAATGTTVVATRPIRAQSVLAAHDVTLQPGATPGAASRIEDVVGMEARRGLYNGRPVMLGDLSAPALVERNALVSLRFTHGPLFIETDARSLGRAGLGERVRVMNLDSRNAVTATVIGPNAVEVR